MTPEAQQIAIAEACGFKWMTYHGSYTSHHFAEYKPEDIKSLLTSGFVVGRSGLANACDTYGLDCIPDYLNDRSAMQEAVNHLDETQRWNYAAEIVRITGWDRATDSVFALLNVSVEEMAEAFLKALGLWEEENK